MGQGGDGVFLERAARFVAQRAGIMCDIDADDAHAWVLAELLKRNGIHRKFNQVGAAVQAAFRGIW